MSIDPSHDNNLPAVSTILRRPSSASDIARKHNLLRRKVATTDKANDMEVVEKYSNINPTPIKTNPFLSEPTEISHSASTMPIVPVADINGFLPVINVPNQDALPSSFVGNNDPSVPEQSSQQIAPLQSLVPADNLLSRRANAIGSQADNVNNDSHTTGSNEPKAINVRPKSASHTRTGSNRSMLIPRKDVVHTTNPLPDATKARTSLIQSAPRKGSIPREPIKIRETAPPIKYMSAKAQQQDEMRQYLDTASKQQENARPKSSSGTRVANMSSSVYPKRLAGYPASLPIPVPVPAPVVVPDKEPKKEVTESYKPVMKKKKRIKKKTVDSKTVDSTSKGEHQIERESSPVGTVQDVGAMGSRGPPNRSNEHDSGEPQDVSSVLDLFEPPIAATTALNQYTVSNPVRSVRSKSAGGKRSTCGLLPPSLDMFKQPRKEAVHSGKKKVVAAGKKENKSLAKPHVVKTKEVVNAMNVGRGNVSLTDDGHKVMTMNPPSLHLDEDFRGAAFPIPLVPMPLPQLSSTSFRASPLMIAQPSDAPLLGSKEVVLNTKKSRKNQNSNCLSTASILSTRDTCDEDWLHSALKSMKKSGTPLDPQTSTFDDRDDTCITSVTVNAAKGNDQGLSMRSIVDKPVKTVDKVSSQPLKSSMGGLKAHIEVGHVEPVKVKKKKKGRKGLSGVGVKERNTSVMSSDNILVIDKHGHDDLGYDHELYKEDFASLSLSVNDPKEHCDSGSMVAPLLKSSTDEVNVVIHNRLSADLNHDSDEDVMVSEHDGKSEEHHKNVVKEGDIMPIIGTPSRGKGAIVGNSIILKPSPIALDAIDQLRNSHEEIPMMPIDNGNAVEKQEFSRVQSVYHAISPFGSPARGKVNTVLPRAVLQPSAGHSMTAHTPVELTQGFPGVTPSSPRSPHRHPHIVIGLTPSSPHSSHNSPKRIPEPPVNPVAPIPLAPVYNTLTGGDGTDDLIVHNSSRVSDIPSNNTVNSSLDFHMAHQNNQIMEFNRIALDNKSKRDAELLQLRQGGSMPHAAVPDVKIGTIVAAAAAPAAAPASTLTFFDSSSTADKGRYRVADPRLFDTKSMYRKHDEKNPAVTLLLGRRRRGVHTQTAEESSGISTLPLVRPFEESSEEVISCLFDRNFFREENDAYLWWSENKARLLSK